MPNKNYLAGRRFEYERKAAWEAKGYTVLRTAGSRGAFDLICFRPGGHVTMVQCKLVGSITESKRLLAKFRDNPPTPASKHYHQCLECRVKGTSDGGQCFV